MSECDVLVIGAGAAGLTAALTLARSGRRVTLLEARRRVGGRLFTHPHAEGAPIELGAEFVHGRPASLLALIEEAGLATYELDGSSIWCAQGRLSDALEPPSRAYEVLEDMTAWMAPRVGDLSFVEYLAARGVAGEAARPALNYVEGFNAADAARISVAALAAQQRAEDRLQGDRLFRIGSGYGALAQFLARAFVAAGGRLELARPVHRVVWRHGAARVECSDGAHRTALHTARCVLITVPLGVLKGGALAIDPPVAPLAHAARLEMGDVVRVVLRFAHPVWADAAVLAAHPALAARLRDLSFLFTPAQTPATWWTPAPDPTPLLTGWLGGPRATAFEAALETAPAGIEAASAGLATASADGLDRTARVRAHCIETLARVLEQPPGRIAAALIECHTHDWRRDPYARGAYSYVPVGALDAPAQLATPVEDTVYFAGEHTHTDAQWGTVHAAVESGMRAATQISATL